MKNFSEIESLLDRYWEGETTLEEERALKTYFSSGQVDERLRSVAPLFQALREEQAVQFAKTKAVPLKSSFFAWRIWAVAASVTLLLAAGLWWSSNQATVREQVAQQKPIQREQMLEQTKPLVEENKMAAAEAAQPPAQPKKPAVKRKKPAAVAPSPEAEEAMEEIMAALALVSSKIKKGKQEAAKGAIHLENMDKIFKKKSEG